MPTCKPAGGRRGGGHQLRRVGVEIPLQLLTQLLTQCLDWFAWIDQGGGRRRKEKEEEEEDQGGALDTPLIPLVIGGARVEALVAIGLVGRGGASERVATRDLQNFSCKSFSFGEFWVKVRVFWAHSSSF